MKTPLSAVAVALLAALNLVPSLVAEDAAKAPAGEITDLKDIPALLPREIILGLLNNSGKVVAATKATDLLHEKVQGQTVTLKFRVNHVDKERREGNQEGYRINADDVHIRQGAANFKAYLWVNFDVSENSKLAGKKKGDELTVVGRVSNASIKDQSGPELHIDLENATLK